MARMEVPPCGVRQAAQQRTVALLQARDTLHQLKLRFASKQVHIACTRAAAISRCKQGMIMLRSGGFKRA